MIRLQELTANVAVVGVVATEVEEVVGPAHHLRSEGGKSEGSHSRDPRCSSVAHLFDVLHDFGIFHLIGNVLWSRQEAGDA